MSLSILLATTTARQMRHYDMQGVARSCHTRRIKYVASGTHALYGFHSDAVTLYQSERMGRIHQRHINATLVGRIGHHILVTGVAQQAAPGEVAKHAVVLHLAQSHHIGQLPRLAIIRSSHFSLCHLAFFLPY